MKDIMSVLHTSLDSNLKEKFLNAKFSESPANL